MFWKCLTVITYTLDINSYNIFKSQILLDRLLDHVKVMDINSQYVFEQPEEYKQILTNVSDFLSKTKLLTKFEASSYPHDNYKFSSVHLNYLLPGFAANTSIKDIVMTNDKLTCQDIQTLISSLNPQSQVKFINVYGSLRDEGERGHKNSHICWILQPHTILDYTTINMYMKLLTVTNPVSNIILIYPILNSKYLYPCNSYLLDYSRHNKKTKNKRDIW